MAWGTCAWKITTKSPRISKVYLKIRNTSVTVIVLLSQLYVTIFVIIMLWSIVSSRQSLIHGSRPFLLPLAIDYRKFVAQKLCPQTFEGYLSDEQ